MASELEPKPEDRWTGIIPVFSKDLYSLARAAITKHCDWLAHTTDFYAIHTSAGWEPKAKVVDRDDFS